MTSDWEKFFELEAPKYMKNVFTENTHAEIDFIIKELHLNEGNTILDIGCGTGRHSIELARKGFKVTGIDLSDAMLDEARKAADSAGVAVQYIKSNAAAFSFDSDFDAVICLCEGAFSLIGKGEDPFERDLAILKNVSNSLKKGRPFLLTALNGLRYARMYGQEEVEKGIFDPHLLTEKTEIEVERSGQKETLELLEKGYTAGELILMMRNTGFAIKNIWGGTAGAWNRKPLDPDEYEIMISAIKK